MIIAIVHHHMKPGEVERGERRLDANGEAMAAAPGFRFRYRLQSREDALKISTVTAWDSEEAYESYRSARRDSNRGADFEGESPYLNVETELHTVEQEHLART